MSGDYKKNDKNSVHLISDIDETGKSAYYFISVSQEKLPQFLAVVKSSDPMDLSQYGEIVYSAYGDTPPAHIQKWIAKEYGWQG